MTGRTPGRYPDGNRGVSPRSPNQNQNQNQRKNILLYQQQLLRFCACARRAVLRGGGGING